MQVVSERQAFLSNQQPPVRQYFSKGTDLSSADVMTTAALTRKRHSHLVIFCALGYPSRLKTKKR